MCQCNLICYVLCKFIKIWSPTAPTAFSVYIYPLLAYQLEFKRGEIKHLCSVCYLEPEKQKWYLLFSYLMLLMNIFMVLLYCSEWFYIIYLILTTTFCVDGHILFLFYKLGNWGFMRLSKDLLEVTCLSFQNCDKDYSPIFQLSAVLFYYIFLFGYRVIRVLKFLVFPPYVLFFPPPWPVYHIFFETETHLSLLGLTLCLLWMPYLFVCLFDYQMIGLFWLYWGAI